MLLSANSLVSKKVKLLTSRISKNNSANSTPRVLLKTEEAAATVAATVVADAPAVVADAAPAGEAPTGSKRRSRAAATTA